MKKAILGGLAVLGLLTAGLVYGQAAGRARAMGPMGGMMGPDFSGHFLGRLADFLELTDAQRTQVKQIVEASRTQSEPLMKQLRDAHQAIATAVKSDAKPEQVEADVQKIVVANTAAAQQLVVLHARTMSQVLAVLTPEQRDKAEKLHGLLGPARMHRRSGGAAF